MCTWQRRAGQSRSLPSGVTRRQPRARRAPGRQRHRRSRIQNVVRGNGAGMRAVGTMTMRRVAGVTAVTVLALVATGCSGGGHGTTQVSAAGHTAAAGTGARSASGAGVAAPRLTITPGNGAKQADPSAGITVTAAGGTLTHVTVRTSGDAVTGSMSQAGTVWRSQWALGVSQAYTVTATASGKGGTVTTTSAFR